MADDKTIKERAYHIWEMEGRPHGRDREHWDRATREIQTETKTKTESAGAGNNTQTVAGAYRDSRDNPGATGETIPAAKPTRRRKPAG
jgi:hypothetical protein